MCRLCDLAAAERHDGDRRAQVRRLRLELLLLCLPLGSARRRGPAPSPSCLSCGGGRWSPWKRQVGLWGAVSTEVRRPVSTSWRTAAAHTALAQRVAEESSVLAGRKVLSTFTEGLNDVKEEV